MRTLYTTEARQNDTSKSSGTDFIFVSNVVNAAQERLHENNPTPAIQQNLLEGFITALRTTLLSVQAQGTPGGKTLTDNDGFNGRSKYNAQAISGNCSIEVKPTTELNKADAVIIADDGNYDSLLNLTEQAVAHKKPIVIIEHPSGTPVIPPYQTLILSTGAAYTGPEAKRKMLVQALMETTAEEFIRILTNPNRYLPVTEGNLIALRREKKTST